jgi:hypothetical protein
MTVRALPGMDVAAAVLHCDACDIVATRTLLFSKVN